MADTGAPHFIPYVEPTDLVREYPAADEASAFAVAAALDAAGNAGIGSNVVQTVKTDTFTTASTSFVAVTGLAVTITPTSNASKVLVSGFVNWNRRRSASQGATMRLMRGATPIAVGDAVGSRLQSTASAGLVTNDRGSGVWSFEFLDSPSTDGATVYSVEVATSTDTLAINTGSDDGNTSSAFVARTVSAITAIEVAP